MTTHSFNLFCWWINILFIMCNIINAVLFYIYLGKKYYEGFCIKSSIAFFSLCLKYGQTSFYTLD